MRRVCWKAQGKATEAKIVSLELIFDDLHLSDLPDNVASLIQYNLARRFGVHTQVRREATQLSACRDVDSGTKSNLRFVDAGVPGRRVRAGDNRHVTQGAGSLEFVVFGVALEATGTCRTNS